MDSDEESQSIKKIEFIRIIKKHLKTLKQKEIEEISDYDNFIETYKNI